MFNGYIDLYPNNDLNHTCAPENISGHFGLLFLRAPYKFQFYLLTYLGMIKRNIKCKNAAIIMRLYKSLMRPRLEYCIQAWFLYHKKDIEVLKRVQKRVKKMVYGYGDFNYNDRLSLLELSSLEERTVRGI